MSTAATAKGTAKHGFYWGTGRRKTAVARVRIRDGNGVLEINDKPMEIYFPDILQQRPVRNPLEASDLVGKIDCFVNVQGGGISGQAGAGMLGLGRALGAIRPD